jgi:putative sugar O-methyltransferase
MLINIIKNKIILQSKSKSIWSTFKNAFLRDTNLKRFWKNLDKKNLDTEIALVTEKFIFSESYKWVSKYWRRMLINHFKTIKEKGLETGIVDIIKSDYSGFVFLEDKSIEHSVEKIEKNYIDKVQIFKKHVLLSKKDSISYNLILVLLYQHLKPKKIFQICNNINISFYKKYCPVLEIDNLELNQHLLITIFEVEKILEILNTTENKILLEIGSGYGRTANAILSITKNVKYVIADIPLAAYISYKNLKSEYPKKNISFCYDYNSAIDLENAIKNNDVIFILPHQLSFFKNKIFDLTIALGCLMEMEKNDLKRYMNLINILSKSLYFKVWENSGLPNSFYQIYRSNVQKDFFIKDNWIKKFSTNCIAPSNAVDLGFLIDD